MRSNDGIWKLAGTVSGGGADFRLSANGTTDRGAIFDFRDLYILGNDMQYHLAQDFYGTANPIPETSYISNITDVPSSQLTAFVPHAGDVNADGTVNALDFNAIASHFGMSSGAVWFDGDMNFDGKVNSSDFMILANNFNYSGVVPDGSIASGLASGAVPEPAFISTLALGVLAVRRRRH